MPEWLKDPKQILAWVALLGMLGTGVYYVRSIPQELDGIKEAVQDLSAADSAANRLHLELQYTDCEMQGIPIRDCLK